MASGKKAKLALSGGKQTPKKHHCPEHGEECKAVLVMPGRKTRYNCPQGHQLGKTETILK